MKSILVACFLVYLSTSVEVRRLDPEGITRLNNGDILVSTLGLYKMSLKGTGCSLEVSKFDGNRDYLVRGVYRPSGFQSDCTYIELNQGVLRTNTQAEYLKINGDVTFASFTIDDTGMIRLIGYHK